MTHLKDVDLEEIIGKNLVSEPLTIAKDRLEAFTYASYLTEDDVDVTVSRNNALGPELIDGFLLLSLLVHFSFDKPMLSIEGAYAFNYGFDTVRFTDPVMLGETIYVNRTIVQAERKTDTRARLVERVEMFRPGEEKPVMVADWIMLYVDRRAEEGEG